MTTDGLLGERPNEIGHALPVSRILDLCDRIVGEIGRRAHMFGWLRAGEDDRWLTVDAYYPGNRLVVVCSEEDGADEELYAERVPQHGMRLLTLAPSELGPDPAHARVLLEEWIAALGPTPPRPRDVSLDPGLGAVARAMASLAAQPPAVSEAADGPDAPARRVGQTHAAAAERAARFVAGRPSAHVRRVPEFEALRARPHDRSLLPPTVAAREAAGARVASARASELRTRHLGPSTGRAATGSPARQAVGASLGVVLVAVLLAEVYFGVARFAVAGGHVLLAFALALDGSARALGAIAASRADDQPAAWWCVLGGSPFVSGFALFAPSGPVTVEPAPLAGIVGTAASALAGAWLVGAAIGI